MKKRGDKLNAMLEYLRENPNASYKELEENLEIGYNVAKTYAERLRKREHLDGYIGQDGGVKVLKEIPAESTKQEFKEDVVAEMIEIYLEDIRDCKVHNEKIRTGELVIRLLGIY